MPLDLTQYGLRPLIEKDLPLILDWRNSDRIRLQSFDQKIITFEEHLSWFNRTKTSPQNQIRVFEFRNEPAGVVQFNQIKNLEAHWGFYLGRLDLPKGSGTTLGYLGLNWAFGELGLVRVIGEVISGNFESIKFHTRLGFSQESQEGKALRFSISKERWLLEASVL